ncbi:hypothetical protein E3P89_02613 [Wallemia ichthyophaga]|uniref:Delta(3,5)-Delta(2,4)-dienoyl-CoA isomerase, mitochondrial n=1 Tax=Wallemia ichthyophaga TaxID=245174 RepID=A0A4T0KVH0_WALIC|nr:hypothetical protein E3P90_02629 [Wallemia ichthyophaga]TIB11205.1 hypothetical protein E3P93_02637 [Wallemia ichthyophaga]TIB21409.1 hypothetical protein E3P89_02613 [Wallemia ichthyophaga]TIB23174.1 hypothetical protein E3P88_02648 [Wallemia ichthyophaga]TIB61159.1 hypothetical protein E3P78_02851 [Wallemia ichthyophaga]
MKYIKISISDKVAVVELDRLNAFTRDMWREMRDALTTINRDAGVRAVVLVGNGRVFTSGVDVKDAMAAMDSISGKAKADVDGDALQKSIQIRAYIEEFQEAITAIEKCAVPVIAALHGQVVGLGVDIACACDIRYAARSTRFSVKEVDLGLAGTLQRLPRITGNDGLVRELAYTGRVFGAAEALQMGFLSGVSSASTRMSAFHMAMYTATAIAEKSPVAVMSTKKILAYSRDHSCATEWRCGGGSERNERGKKGGVQG